jgi:D-arginine dehydrogenase
MVEKPDFVVIGGGIAGASAAYELAAHGEVVLLEREATSGYHTTGRSAALYTEAWETGVIRALATGSRPFLNHPPDGFVDYPLLAPLPVLVIGRDDQTALVRGLYEEATGGVDVELLDGDGASSWCPLLRPGYVAAAVLEPGSMSIDVDALLHGFLRGLRRRGGTLLLGHGVSSIRRVSGHWVVGTGDIEIRSPVVVNAAGAWCDVIGRMAGLTPIGLVPKRRTAFVFPVRDGIELASSAMVIDVAEQFYFKPEAGQMMGSLADATPMEPHDVRPEEIDVALAIQRIEAATTLQIRHVTRSWAGLRSFVADGLPVVGEDPMAPGFFWLAGQGGVGIMTSPALAQLTAALLTGTGIPDVLADGGVDVGELSVARLCGRG